jgi:signal transduction histidine kinase
LLIRYAQAKKNTDIRNQVRLIIFGAMIPLIFLVISVINIQFFHDSWPLQYLTAPTLPISMMFIATAIFKHHFLNTVPFALKNIVDNMKEAIVVVDNTNRIIEFNYSFNHITNELKKITFYNEISKVSDVLREKVVSTDPNGEEQIINAINDSSKYGLSGQLIIDNENHGKKFFIVNIQLVNNDDQKKLGRVITFYDITDYRNLLEEISASNERIRIARDTHDTIGSTLTLLIRLLELNANNCLHQEPFET